MAYCFFEKAKPIFLKDKSTALNTFAVFRTEIEKAPQAKLHITAAVFYRLTVNGKFVAFGPARTAKGYARVDIIDLFPHLQNGKNEILIEVAGYYCASLSTVKQPSFLCAEIRADEKILAATGFDFEGFSPSCKVRKVKRYSYQRHFGEVWDFRQGGAISESDRCSIEILNLPIKLLTRTAPYPYYEDTYAQNIATFGKLTFDETRPYRASAYSVNPIPQGWGYFDDDEISTFPFVWVQRQKQEIQKQNLDFPFTLHANEYAILDMKRIESGFILLGAKALAESDIVIAFSEDCSAEVFNFTNMNAQTVFEVMLNEGQSTDMMTFEPYTLRYAMVAVKKGTISLEKFGVKSFQYDVSNVSIPQYANPVLTSVYRGAVRTFAHNSLDIFMDCPSRERAGWLCDSYFTGQTEFALFGKTPTEDAFLENYRLYQNEGAYPEGVLPMCYPSDPEPYTDGTNKFIPQWNMWYIIEVADYLTVRSPKTDREPFRESIEKLMAFFKRYENEDGLLEKLPSWNFVEWSDANKWTHDVNYPTNFLYAKVLESHYRIFGDENSLARSREVQKKNIEQSFNGTYFLDHAIRNENGELILQKESSEAGQYYAILFGGFDIHDPKYAELYRLITKVFAAERKAPMPEIFEINAFIGVYLRLEALLSLGEYELVLRDIDEFFGKMEAETGTLWEYRQRNGSRDHGFASFALVAMEKAMKGLQNK